MKWPRDSNSRRQSFADLVCSVPYLPNLLLAEKNVETQVIFLVIAGVQCCTCILWTLLKSFNTPSTMYDHLNRSLAAFNRLFFYIYIHLSRECGPHRDERKSLLASRAAMSQGPSKSLAASQVLLHCTVLLLGFFFSFNNNIFAGQLLKSKNSQFELYRPYKTSLCFTQPEERVLALFQR